MFSPHPGEIKMFIGIVKNVLYYTDESRIFGVLNQILQDTKRKLFKTHKIGAVPDKTMKNKIPKYGSLMESHKEIGPYVLLFVLTKRRMNNPEIEP